MDTTNKYIEMCEKAKGIQERHNFLKAGGILGIHVNGEGNWYFGRTIAYNAMENIWLLRQDQLQEMIHPIEKCFAKLERLWNWWINPKNKVGYCESLEQLWLAFVMKEKYGKVWDSERGEWMSSDD